MGSAGSLCGKQCNCESECKFSSGWYRGRTGRPRNSQTWTSPDEVEGEIVKLKDLDTGVGWVGRFEMVGGTLSECGIGRIQVLDQNTRQGPRCPSMGQNGLRKRANICRGADSYQRLCDQGEGHGGGFSGVPASRRLWVPQYWPNLGGSQKAKGKDCFIRHTASQRPLNQMVPGTNTGLASEPAGHLGGWLSENEKFGGRS